MGTAFPPSPDRLSPIEEPASGGEVPERCPPPPSHSTLSCGTTLHVLLPEKWNPLDKIGRNFAEVHAPVAGSGPMIATAPKLIDAVTMRGPFARFVWGVTPSGRLDHHPNGPPEPELTGDPARFFLRVERQTLHGFPGQGGALFTIRAYLYPLSELLDTPERAAALAAGVRSMTPEQLRYKGLTRFEPALLNWLDARAALP